MTRQSVASSGGPRRGSTGRRTALRGSPELQGVERLRQVPASRPSCGKADPIDVQVKIALELIGEKPGDFKYEIRLSVLASLYLLP